jgi:hypothetical protein
VLGCRPGENEGRSADLEESVWCSADLEVSSYETDFCDCKTKLSIDQLNYKAPDKSHATELVGYILK